MSEKDNDLSMDEITAKVKQIRSQRSESSGSNQTAVSRDNQRTLINFPDDPDMQAITDSVKSIRDKSKPDVTLAPPEQSFSSATQRNFKDHPDNPGLQAITEQMRSLNGQNVAAETTQPPGLKARISGLFRKALGR